jgi:hypothetical protein
MHLTWLRSRRFFVQLGISGILIAPWVSAALAPANERGKPALDAHFEPFRPLLERTWKGTFANSKPENPAIDVMRWERALNGKAIRILHSINEGVYGGESLITWDESKQSLVFHYFTTAGFITTGTMRWDAGKIITHERVSGSAQGVTEVKGISQLNPDGTFHVKSEHRKGDTWSPGHEVTYRQDPAAKVVFR